MYCQKCGNLIADGAQFCPFCGSSSYNVTNGYNNGNIGFNHTRQNSLNSNKKSMNWYNFLVYFALFAGAVWNILRSIILGTNIFRSEYLYRYSFDDPCFNFLHVVFALLLIVAAVFAIAARFKLKAFKKSSFTFLYFYYSIVEVTSLIQIIVDFYCIGRPWPDIGIITSIISGSICLVVKIVNAVYFSKRQNMFTS